MLEDIKKNTSEYYTNTFKDFGDSPKGLDWKDKESQDLRFEQICRDLDFSKEFSILDLGCGTGNLLEFIDSNYPEVKFEYCGLDLVKEMTDFASGKFSSLDNVSFENKNLEELAKTYDYVVASGIFNVRQEVGYEEWQNYVIETIAQMFKVANKAVCFNVLTSYVDFTKEYLFYSDPLYVFDYCKKNFSRFVDLNHSYPLYEYTLTVHKK